MPDFKIDPDYKEVAERLRDLFAKYPEASMRGTYEFVEGHVIYRAECYRTPDDAAPGVGTAWEEVPGRTPYTKGSELQNAETSAWGRAIVAVGASESKRIASADDIRLANDRRSAPPEPQRPAPASKERIDDLVDQVAAAGLADWVRDQNFEWPWSEVDCAAIAGQIADASEANTRDGSDPASTGRVMGRAESLANEALRAASDVKLDSYEPGTEPF